MARSRSSTSPWRPPAPDMASIEVVPATPDRWDDVVTILGSGGERGCWCQAPRGRDAGRPDKGPDLRPRLLREQLAEDPPAGMLAYLDGAVVGWLGSGGAIGCPGCSA